MTDLASKLTALAALADQLDALVVGVKKVGKTDIKDLKFTLERIQKASTDALAGLGKGRRRTHSTPSTLEPSEDWSHIISGGLEPET